MGRYIYSTRSPGEKPQPRGVVAMVVVLRGHDDCDGGSVEIKNKKSVKQEAQRSLAVG